MDKELDRKNSAGIIVALTCLFSIGYAVLRYHVVGPVPWKDLPFYTLNKGIALSAFILLTFNFSFGPMNNLGIKVPDGLLNSRRILGMTGFLMVLIHVLMSYMIFNPAVFGKFFYDNGTLTLMAGLSMLGGIIAFVILWAYNLSFQTHLREDIKFIQFITSRNFLLTAGLFSLIHLFFMGYTGWLKPNTWPGGLPPITLVGFVFFVVSYIINLMGRR